ncbi:unnamed protein product, partial [Rotaria sordida]
MNNDDLVNMNSLDIWTFADQFRATVKSVTNISNEHPILTGMALGLNSTLEISEGNRKLTPCPMLLISNSDGLLQVYYFIHKSLPSICRIPEIIKPNQTLQSSMNNILGTTTSSTSSSQMLPFVLGQPTATTSSSSNGFSFTNFGFTSPSITNTNSQSKEKNMNNILSSIQSPVQTINTSTMDDLSKSINMNNLNKITTTTTKITTNNDQSSTIISNNKKLPQMVDEIQSKLKTLQIPLSKTSESTVNLDESLETLITTLNNMTTSLQTSIQSIKTMTSEHIESITRIENARHQIKLCQKENFYHLLKDRELDPWTQTRLDSIKNKYDQVKHNLNVLLQLTHKTIHNKSLSRDDNDIENEDFLPDLELLNTSQTMKQGIQKRLRELSHKVSDIEKDLQIIYTKFNKDLLSSKQYDSNLTKTTMSSQKLFHPLDSEILLYLQATHPDIDEIYVPQTPLIHLSSVNEQKKSSTIEITKPQTPIQTNSSPTIESESFKQMLRIVRASIDLYSGAASPEQLRELSNTISTSPLSSSSSSIQKSNTISINKTPTIPKTTTTTTTTHSKSPTVTKSLNTTIPSTNIVQIPAKTVTSPIPNISIIPATPTISSDISSKIQSNKPLIQTSTDLTKTSGDSVIRSLLNNNTVSTSPTPTSNLNQPLINSTTNQIIKSNIPNALTSQVTNQAPTTTITTSVQSISPTTKPIISTGLSSFGSKPILGSNALNLTPTTSPATPFGITAATTTNTGSLFGNVSITTTSAPSSLITTTAASATPTPFGTGFGAPTTTTTVTTSASTPFSTGFGTPTTTTTTATTSPSTPFGTGFGTPTTTTTAATSPSTPFGIGFGTPTSTTTAATSVSAPFGTGFGTPTTSTPATSASSTGLFATATTSASTPFGTSLAFPTTTTATTSASGTGIFGTPATLTSTSSLFGSGFGTSTTTTSAPSTSLFGSTSTTSTSSPFGSGFGAALTSTAPSTSTFGSTTTTSPFGSGFGASSTASPGATFGGFGSTSTASTSGTSAFGSSGFPFTSTAKSTAGTSLFGSSSSTPAFGSSFSGFGTQANLSGSSTGFSFGGFGGAQPAETTT